MAEVLLKITQRPSDNQCSLVEQSATQHDTYEDKAINLSDLYVRKTSLQRAFVPNVGSQHSRLKTVKPTDNWSDYISFRNDTVMENEPEADETIKSTNHSNARNSVTSNKKKKKLKTVKEASVPSENLFNYITLKVNKIQGNPNKRKKNK